MWLKTIYSQECSDFLECPPKLKKISQLIRISLFCSDIIIKQNSILREKLFLPNTHTHTGIDIIYMVLQAPTLLIWPRVWHVGISSLTRDRPCAPCSRSVQSYPLHCQGYSSPSIDLWPFRRKTDENLYI